MEPWKETTVVGTPRPRVDGEARVTGAATYTMDLALPGMLHAAVARCPHAHAEAVSVDAARAAALPGVRAVLTGASPGARVPWYDGTSWLFDPHCRYEGEEVAAVAAETASQAAEAAAAVAVTWKVLPFVLDPAEALAPGSPALHPGGNRVGDPVRYARGDVARGLAEADAVRERTYRTSCEIHTPLETHVSVARWEGDHLTVWDSTQGVFGVRAELAEALGLPLSRVRVLSPYMGGGFGSKLELSKHTVIAALLARATGRPVKLAVTREDSFRCVGNRPPHVLTLKAGIRKDGTLTALRLTGLSTGGAYPSRSVAGHLVADLYLCPNVEVEETTVCVNAGRARAFRAPGFPQGAWALEQMVDELAEAVGLDPVEVRLRNVPEVSQRRGGIPYTSTGLARCLSEGAKAFGWSGARARPRSAGPVRRGVGVAACLWGYPGDPRATALVRVLADGSVSLVFGASDIGTGTKTVMAMVAAEELGIDPGAVEIEHADTATTPFTVPSGGSQTVLVSAPAVRAAAADAREQILRLAAPQVGADPGALSLRDGAVVGPGGIRIPLREVKGLQEQEGVLGIGRRAPHPEGSVALPFAAQFAEVEVDTRTGTWRVVRVLAAHDSGRVMSPLTYRSQVFGGIAMGIGFAATEARVIDRATGKVLTAGWQDYKLPTMLDVPADLACLPIDPRDATCNAVGAKGLGEPATIPTAAAIANALHHALGIRLPDAPVHPLALASLLAERRAPR